MKHQLGHDPAAYRSDTGSGGAARISLRLRTEDPQIVASECGTNLKMLSDHYSFPIEDLRQQSRDPSTWSGAPLALP